MYLYNKSMGEDLPPSKTEVPFFALDSTLSILAGIGSVTEQKLYRMGVSTWKDLSNRIDLLPSASQARTQLDIEACYAALKSGDISHFSSRIPRPDHWKIAAAFPERVIFLDIETTGLSRIYHDLTLVGWSQTDNFSAAVGNIGFPGLDNLIEKLASGCILVTYNGSHFDLPFLRHHLSVLPEPVTHIDLRHLGRRVGLAGGQKKIELELGIQRSRRASGLDGELAPALWYRYRRGNLQALAELIEYNHADVEGMKHLFHEILRRLGFPKQVIWPSSSFESWQREDEKQSMPVLSPFSGDYQPRLHLNDLSLPPKLRVVGIDLSGGPKRPTGWAQLVGPQVVTTVLKTDDEIIKQTLAAKPDLVSIDAPLSLPAGRMTVEDSDPNHEQFGIARTAERILWARGVKTYPALIRSMQALTARGIRLANTLRSHGVPVIESFPGAMQDILGMPRKGMSLPELKLCLRDYGLSDSLLEKNMIHDEIDAISSAIVGQTFWAGFFEPLGSDDENYMIVPALQQRRVSHVITLSGPVAVGKTKLAELLENKGFARARYSEVLAEEARSDDREVLRRVGASTQRSSGQRSLNERVYARVSGAKQAVIDGARYPEDIAFSVEYAGGTHLSVFLEADHEVRRERWGARRGSEKGLEKAEADLGEQHLDELRERADLVFDNTGSMYNLEIFAAKLAKEVHP